MRKLLVKLRYFLALAVIALTISNVTLSSNHNATSSGYASINNIWIIETK